MVNTFLMSNRAPKHRPNFRAYFLAIRLAAINADDEFEGQVIDRQTFERMWLLSSEMIMLHDPQLVQSLQKLIGKQPININELVEQAVQQYLDTQQLTSST